MGWASGSQLAESVWSAVEQYIPPTARPAVAREIIAAFRSEDCDTVGEAEDLYEAAFPTPFPRDLPHKLEWQQALWDAYRQHAYEGERGEYQYYDEWYTQTKAWFIGR